jgi:hypothetical protein
MDSETIVKTCNLADTLATHRVLTEALAADIKDGYWLTMTMQWLNMVASDNIEGLFCVARILAGVAT